MAPDSEKRLIDEQLRSARATAWMEGQSAGPYIHGLDADECHRISELALSLLRDRNGQLEIDLAGAESRIVQLERKLIASGADPELV